MAKAKKTRAARKAAIKDKVETATTLQQRAQFALIAMLRYDPYIRHVILETSNGDINERVYSDIVGNNASHRRASIFKKDFK